LALSLRLQRGVSLEPAGDVILLEVTEAKLPDVMTVLGRAGLGQDPAMSMTTSNPMSVVAAGSGAAVNRDVTTATWEEVLLELGRTSNMSWRKLLVMAVAGFVAVIGIATDAVHIVVGAMVIAPGFEPLVRISLGLINQNRSWRDGLSDTIRAYGAMAGGAALAAGLTLAFQGSPLGAEVASYLPPDSLISYWSTTSWSGVAVAIVAGAGGALLIALSRPVLTAGVMIALALVPSWSLTVAALLAGDVGLAASAGFRWAVEAVLVIASSLVVLAAKRRGDGRALPGSDGGRPIAGRWWRKGDRLTRPAGSRAQPSQCFSAVAPAERSGSRGKPSGFACTSSQCFSAVAHDEPLAVSTSSGTARSTTPDMRFTSRSRRVSCSSGTASHTSSSWTWSSSWDDRLRRVISPATATIAFLMMSAAVPWIGAFSAMRSAISRRWRLSDTRSGR
jgi:hypothetical protein